jgi:hypothetical protein
MIGYKEELNKLIQIKILLVRVNTIKVIPESIADLSLLKQVAIPSLYTTFYKVTSGGVCYGVKEF